MVVYIENGLTGLRPYPYTWSKEKRFAIRLCPQIEGDTMLLKQKFQPFLEYLRRKGYQEKSIKEYKNCLYGTLSHSIQDIEVRNLKLTDIPKVIEAGRSHGVFGPQRSVVNLRNYLKYLKEDGVKLPFDWRDIEVPKVPTKQQPVFDTEEMFKVFELFPMNSSSVAARRMGWTMRTLFEVLFSTGLRIFEVLKLQRKDFEAIKRYKELPMVGKGGGEELVFFTDRSIEWLDKYLAQRIDTSESMFVNSVGEPLKGSNAKSYVEHFKKKHVGFPAIEKLKFHSMRRTFVSYLFEEGMDIKSVQMLARHKSERTTLKHYVRANKKRTKEAYQRIMGNLSTTS